MEIGERIRERRRELSMTQQEVADKAEMTYQSVLNAESGKSCTLETLKKICRALDLTIELN
jgi:transcriptional regulator with XRE-family HTH domain